MYTLFLFTGKLGWSSIYLRFSQFEPEVTLDGMLNFKTHFMIWYCVWHEHCHDLFNIRNLVSSLILMFVRICLCDTILYTWFGKKWKWLKKFWGWKMCLVYAYFSKHLSLSMLISFMLWKKRVYQRIENSKTHFVHFLSYSFFTCFFFLQSFSLFSSLPSCLFLSQHSNSIFQLSRNLAE